jgi:hypothetical protein
MVWCRDAVPTGSVAGDDPEALDPAAGEPDGML